MLYCLSVVNNGIIKIKKIEEKIRKSKAKTIAYEKKQVIELSESMTLGFLEAVHYTEDNEMERHFSKFKRNIKNIKKVEESDVEEFCDLLLDLLYDIDRVNINYNYYCCCDDYFDYDMHNHTDDIEEATAKDIASKIKCNYEFNVLDVIARKGRTLLSFKDATSNLFGAECNDSYLREARIGTRRIIKSDAMGIFSQHASYDLVFTKLRVKGRFEANTVAGRLVLSERELLDKTNLYIREDGINVISIPYYRLSKQMCTVISRNYEIIDMVKGSGKDYNARLVHIIARKKRNKDILLETYDRLYSLDYEALDTNIKENAITIQGTKEHEIKIIKGNMLDMDDLENLASNSSCMEDFKKRTNNQTNKAQNKKPLLPFNIGQLGLVLTSGCLDGVIEEGDGNAHLVKGRVSKKTDTTRDVVGDAIERKDIISNRVEITILKPNGEFKTLA